MKPLGSWENPANASITLNSGKVGSLWGANFVVSKQVPKVKRIYNRIIGKQFTQHTSFNKKIGISGKFKRPIFYKEEITIVKRGGKFLLNGLQGIIKRPRVYIVSVGGVDIFGGGVTYRQLKKCFTPV